MSPIYINNKKIESIYTNNQSIGKVYVGDVLVFQKNNNTGDDGSFTFTIDTRLGTGYSFYLPLRSGYNYNFTVDWGDGSSDVITGYKYADQLHGYSKSGVYTISITGLCEYFSFNNGGDKLKLVSIDQWGNTGFINMNSAFRGCTNLTTVNYTDGTWCSNVTDMSFMFYNCPSLETLDVSNWDVSKVTDMSSMFGACELLTELDVSNWNVSKVTDMNYMFHNCYLLTTLDVSTWDVSAVTDFSFAFQNCSSLTTLDASAWVISTNLIRTGYNGTFVNCGTLDLKIGAGWNFSVFMKGYNASLFLSGTNIGSANYDNMLSIIASQALNDNVTFGGGNSKYTAAGKVHRDAIVASNSWTFNDGGLEA